MSKMADEEKVMMDEEEKALIEENKKAMLSDEEKVMIEEEEDRVVKVKPIVIERFNHTMNLDTEKLVKQEVTISCAEQRAGRKLVFPVKFKTDENEMFLLRKLLTGESKPEVGEDKDKIEALLSTKEFLALLEVKHGLKHAVNLRNYNTTRSDRVLLKTRTVSYTGSRRKIKF